MHVSGTSTVDLVTSAKGDPGPEPTPNPQSPDPHPHADRDCVRHTDREEAVGEAEGRKAKLAKKTQQDAKVSWKSMTKKVCTVKKYTVKATKKGKCKLSAKAPVGAGIQRVLDGVHDPGAVTP